jgi:hypothetical protein
MAGLDQATGEGFVYHLTGETIRARFDAGCFAGKRQRRKEKNWIQIALID